MQLWGQVEELAQWAGTVGWSDILEHVAVRDCTVE